MRRGRPGLLGTMARTAVIAGTATAVSGRVAHGQADRAAASQQQAAANQQAMVDQAAAQLAAQAPPPPAAPAAGMSMGDKITQIKELGQLKDAGLLTDAEFEVQKAKILAS